MARRTYTSIALAVAGLAAAVLSVFLKLRADRVVVVCGLDEAGRSELARAYSQYQLTGLCALPLCVAALLVASRRAREWFTEHVVTKLQEGDAPHWTLILALYPLSFLALALSYNLPIVGNLAEAIEDSITVYVFYPFAVAATVFYPIAHSFSPAGVWGDPYLIWAAVTCFATAAYIWARILTFALGRTRRRGVEGAPR